eukprot:573658_1
MTALSTVQFINSATKLDHMGKKDMVSVISALDATQIKMICRLFLKMACNPRMHKMANHTAYKSIGTTLYDTIRGRPHDHVSTNTYIGSISKDLVGHITTFLPTHTLAQMALTNRFIGKSVINTPLQSLRLTAKICANFFRSTLRLNQFRKLR